MTILILHTSHVQAVVHIITGNRVVSSKSKWLWFIKECKGCPSWLCDDGAKDQEGERDRLNLMIVENVKVLSNRMNISFEHSRGVDLTFELRHLNRVITGNENMPCFKTDKSN